MLIELSEENRKYLHNDSRYLADYLDDDNEKDIEERISELDAGTVGNLLMDILDCGLTRELIEVREDLARILELKEK